ncbi:hypothetical protein SAMN05216188_1286 [Lentzea xinjiangensis]|uniref:DUF1579 domain-containing protein n=1 Tax=Lentzea xinjiangensis TaxID=402600 RepID=A0A1H9VT57_9PSEU|nr:hypothetical protein [Lentzea xinjiangensis]SES25000.1 hypothetical protein SAMN05216188_1286 [Lentzea xinjiangensis]
MSENDFDFLHGTWHVANRKIADIAGRGAEWVEFDARAEVRPVLGGAANVDTIRAAGWEGMTLRQYDPADGVWRIWWASSRAPGKLDPPLEGRFTGGHGVFSGDDVVGGQAVRVRFDWTAGDAPVWRQQFSHDGGQTWEENWVMRFTRA